MTQLIQALEDLLTVLEDERKALVENQLDSLLELIKLKEIKTEEIMEIEKTVEDINEEEKLVINSLVEQVQSLQEINTLLTEQAMSYYLTIIEGLEKNLEKASNTYSKDGAYEKVSESTIINKSI